MQRLLILTILGVMIFIDGCATSPDKIYPVQNKAIMRAVPDFPNPKIGMVEELKQACAKNECSKIYLWLGKLRILHKQLIALDRLE